MGQFVDRVEYAAWSAAESTGRAVDNSLRMVDRAAASGSKAVSRTRAEASRVVRVGWPVAVVATGAGRQLARHVGSKAVDGIASGLPEAAAAAAARPFEDAAGGLSGAAARWGRLAKYRLSIEEGRPRQ